MSLPVFPSQDGPGHKFYAGVLGRLLSGDSYGQAYFVRHPLPPYASQDYMLAAASRFIDIDLAEKLYVCLVMLTTALSVRFCCRRMGPAGATASLFVFPLLLHWPLIMGFMNFSLGLGLMLLCFGMWLRAEKDGSSPVWLVPFALTVLLLTFTHPVPLLMLLLLCGYDLTTQKIWGRKVYPIRPSVLGSRVAAMFLLCAAFAYPVLSQNASRSSKDVAHSVFELHAYVNEMLLYGLSPFFRHSPWISLINLYRTAIWTTLLVAVFLGGHGLLRRFRQSRAERTDFMTIGAVLLLFAIPLMPDTVNGATHFFIRMQVVAWIFALFGASRITISRKGEQFAMAAAIVFTGLTLLPAERVVRPIARQIAALDRTRIPTQTHGLMLRLASTDDNANAIIPDASQKLAADVYLWSSMVPMLHAHDIPVNSPWLDATYLALGPGSDPDLLYNIVGNIKQQQDIDQHDGNLSKITPAQRAEALADAQFVFAVRGDATQKDLSAQIGSATSAFTCDVRDWYLLCLRNQAQAAGK